MTVQKFEVIQDSETGRVELFENGVAFMGAPARINLRDFLVRALTDTTPILISATTEFTADRCYSVEGVAALIEEMQAKWYSQMKARGLKVMEGVLHRKSLAGEPEGALLIDALDDAVRAALDILYRRAPEITPELIADAIRNRHAVEKNQKDQLEAKAECDRLARDFLDVYVEIERAKECLSVLENRRKRLEARRDAVLVRQQIQDLSKRLSAMC